MNDRRGFDMMKLFENMLVMRMAYWLRDNDFRSFFIAWKRCFHAIKKAPLRMRTRAIRKLPLKRPRLALEFCARHIGFMERSVFMSGRSDEDYRPDEAYGSDENYRPNEACRSDENYRSDEGCRNDEYYMQRAIALARRGEGAVHPNPMVGAVLVKDGRVIAEDYHRVYGGFHAERGCLLNCREPAKGGTLYVTLEPCCHYGKTPPCTDIIIDSGVRRVVVGTKDPNPLVSGRGIQILKDHGIEVVCGVCREECLELNRIFFHYIRTGMPYVTLKYAMTMDGKTAAASGKSRWITGEAARHRVHEERGRHRGIMVGIGTALADDPLLTCRLEGQKSPVRIVCDSALRLPLSSKLVQTARQTPLMIATACTDEARRAPYMAEGCQLINVPRDDGGLKLDVLMRALGERKIDSILLEGGSTLAWSALKAGVVQRVLAFIAPKILGGCQAPGAVGGPGAESPDAAFKLKLRHTEPVGCDFLMESEVISDVYRDC